MMFRGNCKYIAPRSFKKANPFFCIKPFWIKTDTNGIQIWDLMWGGGFGGAFQVVESNNECFYSAGAFKETSGPFIPSIFKFYHDGTPAYRQNLISDTIVGGDARPIALFNDSILIVGIDWRVNPINVDDGFSEILKIDTLGNIMNRRILLEENQEPWCVEISEGGKIIVSGNYVTDGNWDIYLWKMNENLEDDTLYTQPLTYDSLCPYEIQSDTVDLDCGLFVNIDELPTKEEYESTIKIYPNPAREWAVLTLPDVVANGEVELVVYDIFGRKVEKVVEVVPVNRMFLLDVASYPAGMYVAVAVDRKGKRYTGKFVVAGH